MKNKPIIATLAAQYALPVPWHEMTTKMAGLGISLTTEMFPLGSAPNLKF